MSSNDHWTLDLQTLGMERAGDELAKRILTCQPPYAICVHGKWGSGKTSLMRYAMARLGGEPLGLAVKTSSQPTRELPDWLEGQWRRLAEAQSEGFLLETFQSQLGDPKSKLPEPRVAAIWFNPWQHQEADIPLVALLQELQAQFTYLVKVERFAKKYLPFGVEAGLNILGDLADSFVALQGMGKTSFGQIIPGLRRAAEANAQRHFEGMHDAQRLNLLFEQAVERLLTPPGAGERKDSAPALDRAGRQLALRRLVIFVDDLDRCSEQQTVRLLEAIKLYLQTRYCVFVFGMDGAAARRAVCSILPHKGVEEGQEYLEKLFQATLYLPTSGNYKKFVKTLLEDAEIGWDEEDISVAEVTDRVVRLVEPNPRKLKSFVSTLAVGWAMQEQPKPPVRFSLFLLLTFLRVYHPEVFRLLAHAPQLAEELTVVCSNNPPQRPSATYLFFHRAFRHAARQAFTEGTVRTRQGDDEVALELIPRLDRHKGDRAFLELWEAEFQDADGPEGVRTVMAALRPDLLPEVA